MPRFSLTTTSFIIKIRRFILRGPRPSSLRSLGAYPFIRLGLEIVPDLLWLRGTNGQVGVMAIGSTARYLWRKLRILKV
jgi:hypothetical protein